MAGTPIDEDGRLTNVLCHIPGTAPITAHDQMLAGARRTTVNIAGSDR